MPSGILIVDKPEGWTSMDVCAKLRGVLGERRIGHAGTLDPMATGVLPVFVGRATRAIEFAVSSDKEYLAGLLLGTVTDTQDSSGQVLERHPVRVSPEALESVLTGFRGEILQTPPMYSAVKINGQKLYKLARKGRQVERSARPVTIRALTAEEHPAPERYVLRVRCSKGTYVRTLCHEIGGALGCGGCMDALRRTQAAGFSLADAVTLDAVLSAPDPAALLRPVDSLFSDRPALTADESGARRIRCGAAADAPDAPGGEYRVYDPTGAFLALGRVEGGRLLTIKSFFDV